MHRFRLSVPFLTLALLLALAVPTLAEPEAGNPVPAPALQLTAPSCEVSSPLPEPATAKLFAAAIQPPIDFILCTCKRCKAEPETICQISPSGYSIRCEDWAETHC